MNSDKSAGGKRAKPLVLIVDDEPDIIEYLAMVLEDNGFSTLGAQDGELAREVLKNNTPALILLDVMMPGHSGFALYREIRKNKRLSGTPVFLISGYAKAGEFAETDLNELKEEGYALPDGYLEKPIAVEYLLERIESVMKSKE